LETSYYKDKKLMLMKSFFLCFLIFTISCGIEETNEEIAQRIDRTLMCPVCPAETLDQSQSELAKQMKSVIRIQLSEGRTDQEIIDYFVQRYGEEVLSSPPKSGSNLIAWITPVVLLILITLILSIRLIKKSIIRKNEI
tara:strand:- start:101 stop:517 length:417 start_codon:yes stop_codon:yes gene_type:complete